jgi:hypothetical protein
MGDLQELRRGRRELVYFGVGLRGGTGWLGRRDFSMSRSGWQGGDDPERLAGDRLRRVPGRNSRQPGKYVPLRSLGTSARPYRPASPTPVRKPLRWLGRAGVRSPSPAPRRPLTSSAISRSATKPIISRSGSMSEPFSSSSQRAILSVVIVVSSPVWSKFGKTDITQTHASPDSLKVTRRAVLRQLSYTTSRDTNFKTSRAMVTSG